MRILRRGLPLLAFSFSLAGFLADPVTADALWSRTNCWEGFRTCVDEASQLDTFWRRSVAGLCCYGDLVSCLRDAFV
jgi:hypothetical protein